MDLAPGYNLQPAWLNRLTVLDWIYDNGGNVAGTSVAVGGLYKDREAAGRHALTADLREFERREWVTLDERLSGIAAVTLQPSGVDFIESIQRLRGDAVGRRRAARDAVLRWLYDRKVGGQPSPVISAFSESPYGYYYGHAFTETERKDAGAWLKEGGYLKGAGSWGGGILRPSITAEGERVVESDRSVNEGPIAGMQSPSEISSVKMSNMVKGRSPQTLSQILAGPMSRLWAGGSGPTRTAIDGALQSAGIDPADYQGNKEAVVRTALAGAKGQTAIDLVHDLIDLLREDGCFESPDGARAGAITRLQDAFARVGCTLTDEGTLTWANLDELSMPTGNAVSVNMHSHEPQARNATLPSSPRTEAHMTSVPTIFLVHGHDTGLREKVEIQLRRWINQVELVILDQQASRGRTLVEKFEKHAETASMAIVLATHDDEGRALNAPVLNPRARQNVVFEMGYFFAKLGRGRVVVLNAGVETPSDVAGIVYINPKLSDWRQRLARELDAAGIEGDWLK